MQKNEMLLAMSNNDSKRCVCDFRVNNNEAFESFSVMELFDFVSSNFGIF